MKWLLQGYYGYGNFGDDLMLALLIDELRRIDPGAEFKALLGVGSDRRDLATIADGVGVVAGADRRAVHAAIRDCDVLVTGGGTCLHEHGSAWWRNTLYARCRRRPVIWLGIGAEQARSTKRRILNRLVAMLPAAIGCRDDQSLDLIRRWRPGMTACRRTGDLTDLLALSNNPCLATRDDGERRDLLVAWRDFSRYLAPPDIDAVTGQFAVAVMAVAQEIGADRILVTSLSDVDSEANHALLKRMSDLSQRSCAVTPLWPQALHESLEALSRARLVISARMHGFLVAKMLGAPAVGIGYASKVMLAAGRFDVPPVVPLEELRQDATSTLLGVARPEWAAPAVLRRPVAAYAADSQRNLDLVRQVMAA